MLPEGLASSAGPLWSRRYWYPDARGDQSASRHFDVELGLTLDGTATCKTLERALAKSGAKRMVVGHTVMPSGRIGSACGGLLWGTQDVGMSSGMSGAAAAVLQVAGSTGTGSAPTPLYAA